MGLLLSTTTAQKRKVSIKDFFSIYDQIRRKERILSHLLNKSLMENFIFCAVSSRTQKSIQAASCKLKNIAMFSWGYQH